MAGGGGAEGFANVCSMFLFFFFGILRDFYCLIFMFSIANIYFFFLFFFSLIENYLISIHVFPILNPPPSSLPLSVAQEGGGGDGGLGSVGLVVVGETTSISKGG